MTLTLYLSKRFENTIMDKRIGTFLGVSVHLPCLVVCICDNRIAICCKLTPLYLFSLLKQENIHHWKASFETSEAMLSICLAVYYISKNLFKCSLIGIYLNTHVHGNIQVIDLY